MVELRSAPATVECRIVLVQPESKAILGFEMDNSFRLPVVIICRQMRPAQQISKAVEMRWGIKVLILDFLSDCDRESLCVASIVLDTTQSSLNLLPLPLEQLSTIELSEEERSRLLSILNNTAQPALSRVGWLDAAVDWVQEVTGQSITSKADIEQLNAGGGFALIRFSMKNVETYWFKATGEPNLHECTLTALLAELCPDCLPRFVALKKKWNAWLTKQAGAPLPNIPEANVLARAATQFATLQIQTCDRLEEILDAGAFDQRARVLRNHIEPVIAYLIEAMERQESIKVPALSRDRLFRLAEILDCACLSMESLGIPDTLIHNDLNRGNILVDQGGCVFIDWSEAAIGNPFLACERLCQVNREHRLEVNISFRRLWVERISAESIEQAFVLAPLVAIYAYLYGRGNWPRAGNISPHSDSYARSLARHMDREAQTPALQELLCK
jgi:hypothetical protein